MKRQSITVELITPCFLAGAENTDSSLWRAASIRGQLRWWFRALAPGSIDEVRHAEEALFGSTSQQSTIVARTIGAQPKVELPSPQASFGGGLGARKIAELWGEPMRSDTIDRIELRKGMTNPIHYLGYGCMTWDKLSKSVKLTHPMIRPGQKAAFMLQWRRPGDEALLRKVLWAWLNLGAIGAKGRNGFGSMQVVGTAGLDDQQSLAPRNRRDFIDQAATLCREAAAGCPDAPPEWTRFSAGSRIYHSIEQASSWEDALMLAGAWLIAFRRRYGSPRDTRSIGGRKVHNRDYVWAKPGPDQHRDIPERAGFGLPLPFSKKDVVTWDDRDGGDARRASPLHIHVARFGNQYHSVWTYLPARFIPDGSKLKFKDDHRSSRPPTPRHETIIGEFLDDLLTKNLVTRVAP